MHSWPEAVRSGGVCILLEMIWILDPIQTMDLVGVLNLFPRLNRIPTLNLIPTLDLIPTLNLIPTLDLILTYQTVSRTLCVLTVLGDCTIVGWWVGTYRCTDLGGRGGVLQGWFS